METIENRDVLIVSEPDSEQSAFGKAPQPWQLRNHWAKPKRIRKRKATPEIDLWKDEA
jgi:hypothetical protein